MNNSVSPKQADPCAFYKSETLKLAATILVMAFDMKIYKYTIGFSVISYFGSCKDPFTNVQTPLQLRYTILNSFTSLSHHVSLCSFQHISVHHPHAR